MGGAGSNRWHGHIKTTKVEDCQCIDIQQWKREGFLVPGRRFSQRWPHMIGSGAFIVITIAQDDVSLFFPDSAMKTDRLQSPDAVVRLAYTPCNYGGRRVWFTCPVHGCGRKTGKLYRKGNVFACRACLQAAYRSQSESQHKRMLRKAGKIRIRLGAPPGIAHAFPPKPKSMHWKTYYRLMAESVQLHASITGHVADHARKIVKSLLQ